MSRDDMVITPSLGRPRKASAPVRARENRVLADATGKGGVVSKLVKAKLAHSLAGRVAGSAAGATAAGLAVGALVALRLGTGRPFEGIGEDINAALLGHLDDEARAWKSTRKHFESQENFMRILGQDGVTDEIKRVIGPIYQMNLMYEKGASAIRQAFPVDTKTDMLIMRARDGVIKSFKRNGGVEKAKQIMDEAGEDSGD